MGAQWWSYCECDACLPSTTIILYAEQVQNFFFNTNVFITVITEPVCICNCRIACGEFIFVVAIVLLKWQPFENDWYCLYDNHVFACQPDNTHHTQLDTQLSQKRVSLNGN